MIISILSLYNYDNTIFDTTVFPEDVDRDLLIHTIIHKNAEFSLVYSDPEALKEMLEVWSEGNLKRWDNIYKASIIDYNPIENYDRYEDTKINGENDTTGTTTGQVSAYNVDSFANSNKNINDIKANTEQKTVSHIHGNIGVTTAPQMLQEYYKIQLNFYDMIANEFKKTFCIMVY